MSDGKFKIRLASLPYSAADEYHPQQIEYYSRFTELVYEALRMDSVNSFFKEFIGNLSIGEVEIRIMRLPSYKSRIFGVSRKGRILEQQLYGRAWKKKPLIDIFPNCYFPDKVSKPSLWVGLRGFVLNGSIRALIHELLHKSGLHDETEVRKLTDRYYKDFRNNYVQRFDIEIKPLIKEWKKFEKQINTTV